MNGVFPVSKLSQSSLNLYRVKLLLALGDRRDLYYSSLALLKQETALSQKIALEKLFVVGFSYFLPSIGLNKSEASWLFMHTKYVVVFAEDEKKECKEKWQTWKFLMNPTAVRSSRKWSRIIYNEIMTNLAQSNWKYT